MNRLPGVLVRLLLLILAVLLPSAWPTGLPRPDLVILIVAAAALMRGPTTGLLVGLAGGWLLDLVPPGAEPAGASALTYAAVGLILGLTRRLAASSPVLPFIATALGSALVLGVRGITAAAGIGRVVWTELAWTWAITMVVAIIVLPALLAVERWMRERRWA
ncbi:hypothetical protein [Ornithinimicrobium sp. Y1694]|uniref:hypothetical protein n=1 Tax=Ornithinimicrobium sp. Y1694 TaxID=3418590 RepID=UPI003CF4BEF4